MFITGGLEAAVALAVVVTMFIFLAYVGYKTFFDKPKISRNETTKVDLEDYEELRSERSLYGFYDPFIARTIGYSQYATPSGKIVDVTTVTDSPDTFRTRKMRPNMKFYGPVTTFKSNHIIDSAYDVADIALYLYFFDTVLDDFYPEYGLYNAYGISEANEIVTAEQEPSAVEALESATEALVAEQALDDALSEEVPDVSPAEPESPSQS